MFNYLKKKRKGKEVINKYKNIEKKKVDLITFEELSNFPFNKVIQMDEEKGNIECIRFNNNSTDTLSFRMFMKKGAELLMHYHDCEEIILMYEGVIHDLVTKEDTIIATKIVPFKEHRFIAKTDATFYVEFKAPHVNKNDIKL